MGKRRSSAAVRIESTGAVVACDNGSEMLIEAERVILATGT
jgi:glycine/D-amino acid oxidase-like deaminating enzyme